MTVNDLNLIGHAELFSQLAAQARDDTLHHAILLSGPSGIGKAKIGLKLAQALLCDNRTERQNIPCQSCNGCRMVISGNHSDLFLYDPADGEQSSVEYLRHLLQDLSLTSFAGGKKVVLVDNAESLSITSANVLLKSLEEPRPNTHYILISSNSFRLPITIRSRVQNWRCEKLSSEDLFAVINSYVMSDARNTDMLDPYFLSVCDGSVKLARDILENPELVLLLRQLVSAIANKQQSLCLVIVNKLCADKEQLKLSLAMLVRIARNYLRSEVQGDQNSSTAGNDMGLYSRLSIFIQDCQTASYAIFDRNINPLLVVSDIVLRALESSQLEGISRTSASTSLIENF